MKASRLAGVSAGLAAIACASDFGESDMETLQLTLDQMVAEGTSDLLGHVEDIVVSDDSLWVLNSTDPFFLVFDTAARFVRAWGAQRVRRSLDPGAGGGVWSSGGVRRRST